MKADCLTLACVLLASIPVHAENLTLPFGHQKVLGFKAPLKGAVSNNPAVVETHMLSDAQAVVIANGIGSATVTFTFGKASSQKVFTVIVTGRHLSELAADERIEMVKGSDDCLTLPKCTDVRFQFDGETDFVSSDPAVVRPVIVGRELRVAFGTVGQATLRWTSASGDRAVQVVVLPGHDRAR